MSIVAQPLTRCTIVNQLRRTDFMALPAAHKQLLPGYVEKLSVADDLIELNAALVETMLENGSQAMLGCPWSEVPRPLPPAEAGDLEKIRQTMRQLARDWTAEGLSERRASYGPFYYALNRAFPTPASRVGRRVFVPGSGLGRMPVDIACMGFDSVGNEFSYHMLVASNYLINGCARREEHRIAPYVHSFSNHKTKADQFRILPVPDLCAAEALAGSDLSNTAANGDGTANGNRSSSGGGAMPLGRQGTINMWAGEFLDSISDAECESAFHAVCTSFFLDTAHDPVAYVRAIRRILVKDGLWINLGPLTWHYEGGHGRDGPHKRARDSQGNFVGSVELTMDEVMHVVRELGFEVIEEKQIPNVPYVNNERGMQNNLYNCKFFVARNVKDTGSAAAMTNGKATSASASTSAASAAAKEARGRS